MVYEDTRGKVFRYPLNSFSMIQENGRYEVVPRVEKLVFTQFDWEEGYKISACTMDEVQKIDRVFINKESWLYV